MTEDDDPGAATPLRGLKDPMLRIFRRATVDLTQAIGMLHAATHLRIEIQKVMSLILWT
jgi:hypothetical protein